MAFAALVLWLRYDALPHVDRYRTLIVSSIERASGMVVKARAIQGGWEGLRPSLSLEGFELADHAGRTALDLERADVTLSWWALFGGRLRFHDVDFFRPSLELRRGADGLVYLADKPLNRGAGDDGAFIVWLLAQPRLAVHDATLVWRDELTGAPEVRLTRVEIVLRRRLGRNRAALSALPPPQLSGRIDARADLSIKRVASRWQVAGRIFAEGLETDLGGLRAHLPVPESLRAGVGSLRVWVTIANDAVKEVVADVNMRDARAQLAADALPLALASISGRATYRARRDGFSFATEGLRFRLATGEEAVPGRFSIDRTTAAGKPPRVEVRADGIDLKIASTLIDYFPVPRDIKGEVRRFAPRGRLEDAALTWNGEDAARAKSYSLKGRFQDLAVNAVDAWPGATGISGSLEGTQAGGTVHLDSRGVTFTMLRTFRAPIALDRLEAEATWRHEGRSLEVSIGQMRFANADATGSLSGTWRSLPDSPERSPGLVDLKGTLSHASASRVADYLPNRVAQTREWLEQALRSGTSDSVDFELKGDLRRFPYGEGGGHFLVEGDIRDGRLKYRPDWPSVDAVQGSFRFENRRVEIRAREARIFASRAAGVSAVIEDLGAHPPVLTIDGDVDTTGADGMRFLRESPLVNGPGAFTRAIAIDGPGHLKLHLAFPLGSAEGVHVAGDYEFAGATATVTPNLALRNVNGHLSFTEQGVSAPRITGTLFGQPARLRMSSQPDGRVLTTVDSRIEASSLGAFVPRAIADRMSGGSAWVARILSGRDDTSLTVVSDLVGLAVALPAPLAKEAGEARPIVFSVEHLGAPGETTSVDLAGGVQGRFARATVDGVERWNAALAFGTPVQAPEGEGVRLYGRLDDLDVDAWQAVFAAAPPSAPAPAGAPAETAPPPPATPASADSAAAAPVASPAVAAASVSNPSPPPASVVSPAPAAFELRAVDLTLGHVRYFGRDFADMHAKLEHSASTWSGTLESPKVAGEVRWDPAGRGHLTAHLARLALAESGHPGGRDALSSTSDLPALDVTAQRFEFRGHWLGALVLKAEPAGDEWRIDQLDISNGHAKFTSSGGWRRAGDRSLTSLAVKLDTDNLNALLGQFGYGDYLKRGEGRLEGTLVWPGYPYEFALAALAGTLKVEARRGQFAKIEPGAGKLLGLLSLQSLPRRVTLDFRDVFSEGFAFERIQGDVRVTHGILATDAFEISGPSAYVSIAGEVSLPDETQALTLRVVPEVSEGAALAATIIGTPVLGLSTLLVSKLLQNPLGKIVAYQYRVTGSWDNPQVTRVSAPEPKSAAAQPAALP